PSITQKISPPQLFSTFREVLGHPLFWIFIEKTGIRVACSRVFHFLNDVARIKMIKNAHEFSEVNICYASISSYYEDIFIIRALRRSTEICCACNDDRIISERVNQHKLVVDIPVLIKTCQIFSKKILQIAFLKF